MPETIIILDATFNRKGAREFRAIPYMKKGRGRGGGGGKREERLGSRNCGSHASRDEKPPFRQRSLSEGLYTSRHGRIASARNAGSRLDVDVSNPDRIVDSRPEISPVRRRKTEGLRDASR